MHIESYWDIPGKEKNLSIDKTVFQLDEILSKTVKSQMVSNVPIGAFLSGGIDSSLITHYMAKNNSSKLKTYNVGFEQGNFDETPYTLEVSEKYDKEHRVIEGLSMTASDLVDAISSLDQLLGDSAYPLNWFLSKTTKQYITVALSGDGGDGGDELFGGYDKFNQLASLKAKNRIKRILQELYKYKLISGKFCSQILTERDWLLYKKVDCGQFPGNRKDISRFLDHKVIQRIDGQSI